MGYTSYGRRDHNLCTPIGCNCSQLAICGIMTTSCNDCTTTDKRVLSLFLIGVCFAPKTSNEALSEDKRWMFNTVDIHNKIMVEPSKCK